MLYKVLLFLLLLDSCILLAAILLQAAQGGGLAATFGGVSSSAETLFGSRQTSNLLTKASWWSGGLFLGLAFMLSLSSTRGAQQKSVLDNTFQNQPVTPTPLNQSTSPAVPLQTAPTTTQKPATTTKPPVDSKKP